MMEERADEGTDVAGFGLLRCSVLVKLVVLFCVAGFAVTSVGNAQNVDLWIPLFNSSALSCSGSFQFAADQSAVDMGKVDPGPEFLSARAMYTRPVQLYDGSSMASFSTSFLLSIETARNFSLGDGIAFLIAPATAASAPANASGGSLGLFQVLPTGESVLGDRTRIVAVEFDTFTDPWDKGAGHHVGLDINSVASAKQAPFPDTFAIGSGKVGVWIDYDAHALQLEVRMMMQHSGNSTTSSQPVPLLAMDKSNATLVLAYSNFNLSAFVQDFSYVGFSASGTAQHAQVNRISSWHLTTSGLRSPDAPGPAPLPRSEGKHSRGIPSTGEKAAVVAAGLLVALCLGVGAIAISVLLRRRSNKGNANGDAGLGIASFPKFDKRKKRRVQRRRLLDDAGWSGSELGLAGPRRFSYKELSVATRGFSQTVGKGGFGTVFKGVLPDGSLVAVKQVGEDSSQGEREFKAEVTIIGRLRHRNLVEMKGWCHEQGELLLVYDYMPNGSLDRYLFRRRKSDLPPLDWTQRFNVIKGVAAALLHLHEEWDQPVVHRDVKASNVMLDADMNARLTDFGLARLMPSSKYSQTVTITAGTPGYLAPECTYTGKVSAESDVFSFGVVVLEVVSGRRPVDMKRPPAERSLVMWMWSLHTQGGEEALLQAVDASLTPSCSRDWEQVTRVLKVGLLCALPHPAGRPTIRLALQYLMGVQPIPPLPARGPVSLFGVSTSLDRLDIASLMTMTTRELSTCSPSHTTEHSLTGSSALPLLRNKMQDQESESASVSCQWASATSPR